MTSFFDDLEAQLEQAARAQIAVLGLTERRAARRPSVIARRVSVIAAVGVSVFVTVLAIGLLRHQPTVTPSNSTSPTAPGPPAFPHLSARQRKQIDYVMRADGTTLNHDRGCETVPARAWDPARRPSLSAGSPSAALLAMIGTLRRPAGPADRLPPRELWDGPNSKPRTYRYGTYPAAIGIYARYIRYARHRDGANFYLVPAANVNYEAAIPERCYSEQISVLQHELARIPASLRGGIFALQRRYIAYERAMTDPYAGLCLSALNGTGNGDGASCYATTAIAAGHTYSTGGPAGVPIVYGLAPDGVRSATFYYHGRYPGHPLTALAIDNVVILHDPHDALPNEGFPYRLVWRDARGRVLKVITPP